MAVEKQYWTIDELSEYSGFKKATLYNWVYEKKIPYTKMKGTIRFHIERTKAWFDSKEVKAKKAA